MCQEDMFGCLLFVRGFSRGSNVDGSYLYVMSKLSVFLERKEGKKNEFVPIVCHSSKCESIFSHVEFLTQKSTFSFWNYYSWWKELNFFKDRNNKTAIQIEMNWNSLLNIYHYTNAYVKLPNLMWQLGFCWREKKKR